MGTIQAKDTTEEQLSDIREDQLSLILTDDMQEMDAVWLNFDNEETQVKLDMSDLLLDELACEVADILINLSSI